MTRNEEFARALEEYAGLLEAQDVEYKPRSYRTAAENIREHPRPVQELAAEGRTAVERIDGVGDAIAAKIVEFAETGTFEELEEARERLPVEMAALTSVEGVGPKTVGKLYEALGVRTLDDLEAAAREERIRDVKGFGAKTEENIAGNVRFAREAQEREPLGEARPLADGVLAYLRDTDGVERVEVAGSIRRWRDTIGDVDVLVASEAGETVVEAFTDWPRAETVIEAGSSKASVRAFDVRIDLRAVAPGEFGSALQHFTGSWDHNRHLRSIALNRGLKINEYGIFEVDGRDSSDRGAQSGDVDEQSSSGSQTRSGDVAAVEGSESDRRAGTKIGGETEAEVYEALDMPLVPPELREDTGEIEAAREDALPDLVEEREIRGDLHTHTEWSDGGHSIEGMVAAAAERGYDYHCVTDHATGPGMVGGVGLSEVELEEQAAAVREAADDADIPVFHGVEANVAADGSIPYDDGVLADLDVVIASPHSALDQSRGEATDRLVRAVEHPSVDVLGHPTGRQINRRPGLDPDVERVATAAAEHGTALELNANPVRLDLNGAAIRVAVDTGATVAVDTDAHSPAEFDHVRYGVHTARRGWAETADVLNTRDADGLRAFLH